MSRPRIAALAVALAATACATLGLPPGVPVPFDLSGRVLVSYDGRAFSSNLRWQHLPERDELWLLTPLGQTLAQITATTEGATVTGADHKRYHGADVEALTRQALGWELPLTRLQYWVRGEAAPGSVPQDVQRDAEGRISALRQDEWRIKLERYPADQHAGLPRRVDLDRGGNQSIHLVIDAWRGEAAP
ncbi:MAG: outer-rane lipoprotein lolB [Burkholderiales bacterium]|jgi:outer membrane lipoprotein LolB|nr:outer-rane lipoprotein lolB [Burkholderiales bacterium]